MVKVEMVYVASEGQVVHLTMQLDQGVTIADLIKLSKIESSHPETIGLPVGIYAKQVPIDTELKDGDRVEIYRPLTADPKDKRRQRARSKK